MPERVRALVNSNLHVTAVCVCATLTNVNQHLVHLQEAQQGLVGLLLSQRIDEVVEPGKVMGMQGEGVELAACGEVPGKDGHRHPQPGC